MGSSSSWVATVEAADFSPLAALRLIPGLEVAPLPPSIWLRGPEWNDPLALALRKVPGLRRFTVLADDRLLAEGQRVPAGHLPVLTWRPLRAVLAVALPPALEAVAHASRGLVTLVRSSEEQPANALLAPWLAWEDFATTTAELRLKELHFAAAVDGRVWVEGLPMPSLPGQRYHCREGVAVPCGWTWAPAMDVTILRRWLGLAAGDTAFATPDGQWQIIRAEQFVPASRKAARLTASGFSL